MQSSVRAEQRMSAVSCSKTMSQVASIMVHWRHISRMTLSQQSSTCWKVVKSLKWPAPSQSFVPEAGSVPSFMAMRRALGKFKKLMPVQR